MDNESKKETRELVRSPPQVFRDEACIACADFTGNKGLCSGGVDDIVRCIRIMEFAFSDPGGADCRCR